MTASIVSSIVVGAVSIVCAVITHHCNKEAEKTLDDLKRL